ncbi:hypothetical protein J2741_001544 [Methanolinea mesophila]|nr:hypothetical protein [Methanolinea mesophila]
MQFLLAHSGPGILSGEPRYYRNYRGYADRENELHELIS